MNQNPFNTKGRLTHFIKQNIERSSFKSKKNWYQPIGLYVFNLDILKKENIKRIIEKTKMSTIPISQVDFQQRVQWQQHQKLLKKKGIFSFPEVVRKKRKPKAEDASEKTLIFNYKDIVLELSIKINPNYDFTDDINYSITIERISSLRQKAKKDINNYTPRLGAVESQPGEGIKLFSLVVNILSEYENINLNHPNIHWYGELSPFWTREYGFCNKVEKLMGKEICLRDRMGRMGLEDDDETREKLYEFDANVLYNWSNIHNFGASELQPLLINVENIERFKQKSHDITELQTLVQQHHPEIKIVPISSDSNCLITTFKIFIEEGFYQPNSLLQGKTISIKNLREKIVDFNIGENWKNSRGGVFTSIKAVNNEFLERTVSAVPSSETKAKNWVCKACESIGINTINKALSLVCKYCGTPKKSGQTEEFHKNYYSKRMKNPESAASRIEAGDGTAIPQGNFGGIPEINAFEKLANIKIQYLTRGTNGIVNPGDNFYDGNVGNPRVLSLLQDNNAGHWMVLERNDFVPNSTTEGETKETKTDVNQERKTDAEYDKNIYNKLCICNIPQQGGTRRRRRKRRKTRRRKSLFKKSLFKKKRTKKKKTQRMIKRKKKTRKRKKKKTRKH